MTTRWPAGRLCAVSGFKLHQHASSRFVGSRVIISSPLLHQIPQNRQYAQKTAKRGYKPNSNNVAAKPEAALPPPDAVKSAFEIVEANAEHDPINPPPSTIPPPLTLPTRGNEAAPVYWFNLGRAYGRFYKDGIKAVWYNYKASRLLKEYLQKERGVKTVDDAVEHGVISRSEYQLLMRNDHDIGKLPLFGLMVLVFGEWLVLIVPFVPNTVPGTCRIPKQLRGMQEKQEERRRRAFMLGISEPSTDQWPGGEHAKENSQKPWPVALNQSYINDVVGKLRPDQLYHLSSTLGLHKHLWDRLQLPPPSFLLRRAVRKRLRYLAQDDLLLLNISKPNDPKRTLKPAASLSPDELRTALSERGFDVLGQKDERLRERLKWWLERQARDEGRGRALLGMLFRRLVMREWVKLHLEANDGDRPEAKTPVDGPRPQRR